MCHLWEGGQGGLGPEEGKVTKGSWGSRMSTESPGDPAQAQPEVYRGQPEIAVSNSEKPKCQNPLTVSGNLLANLSPPQAIATYWPVSDE